MLRKDSEFYTNFFGINNAIKKLDFEVVLKSGFSNCNFVAGGMNG